MTQATTKLRPAHEFNVGDNITVFDPHTSVAPFMWPTACYVQAIDGDYYIMRKRSFTDTQTFRVGKYYPHMQKES